MSEGSRVGDGTLEQLADAVRCSSSAQFGGCAAFQGCEDVAVRRELAVKNTLAKKEGKWLGRSELSKGKSDMQDCLGIMASCLESNNRYVQVSLSGFPFQ